MDPKNVERALIYTLIIILSAAIIAGGVALVVHFTNDSSDVTDGNAPHTTVEADPGTETDPPVSSSPETDIQTETSEPDTDSGSGDETTAEAVPVTVTKYDEPKIMYALSNVNVRASWSTQSIILGLIYQSEAVTVTGETDNGWYVVDFRGYTGYIFAELLSDDSTAAEVTVNAYATPKTMYAAQDVNVRESYSTNSAILEQIAAGTEVTVLGITDNKWYQISYNDGVAYIRSEYLTTVRPTPPAEETEDRGA